MTIDHLEMGLEHEIKVDKEFRDLIPPLSDEEYRLLEDNLVNNGCLDPIIVWKGQDIIVDGHNRYQICRKLCEITYQIKEIEFANRNAVKLWIIQNQLGRRNLNKFQRSKFVLQMEELIQEQAKTNQSAGGGSVRQKSAQPIKTREKLAELAEVSHDTITKVKKIIKKADLDDQKKVESGEVSINEMARKLKSQEKGIDMKPQPISSLIQSLIKSIGSKVQKLSKMKMEITSSDKENLNVIISMLTTVVDHEGIAA